LAKSKSKILIFDIETAPAKGAIWGAWKQNIPFNMMLQDWYMLSFAAKWLDGERIMYSDLRDKPAGSEDDSHLVRQLHSLFGQADIVVAHNGDKFDIRRVQARFVKLGLGPTSPFHSIDTVKVSRRSFDFPYHSLEYLTKTLLPEAYWKKKSAKFPGYALWEQCLAGNPEAWQEMEDYNRQDVVALEALYRVLRPWLIGHPNVTLSEGDAPDEPTCPNCGSTKVHKRGTQAAKLTGVYQRYKCMDCGKWSRSRTTITTPTKRRNILVG